MNKFNALLVATLLLFSFSSCSSDSYEYPKVQLELMDFHIDNEGAVEYVELWNNRVYAPEKEYLISTPETPSLNFLRGYAYILLDETKSRLLQISSNIKAIPIVQPKTTLDFEDDKTIINDIKVWFSNNKYINTTLRVPLLQAKDNISSDQEQPVHLIGVLLKEYRRGYIHLELAHKLSEKSAAVGNKTNIDFSIDIARYLQDGNPLRVRIDAVVNYERKIIFDKEIKIKQ